MGIPNKEEIIARASKLAVEYKHQGFHCSESMIRAIPEALGLTIDMNVTRAACGFFGGGGGKGGRCGIVQIGIMLIGLLYSRIHPLQSEQDVRILVGHLLERFEKEIGSLDCRVIKPAAVMRCGPVMGCEETYIKGAAIVTDILLSAPDILRNARQ